MNPFITINKRLIGIDYPPFVIAELSANHNGKLETAMKIIEAAKYAGAEAIKLQTYTPDTITINSDLEDFQIHGGLWDGKTLYELYREAHMPWEWHKPLFKYAHSLGITIFSTPFDSTAVDLLEDLNVPAYKIASFEIIDLPLIKYVASTGKPMIISTGLADINEIEEAISTAHEGGCKELAILHCVSGYPAPAEEYNLRTIGDMISRYGLVTGLSDHTIDNATSITSIALGAAIIEKHFTLNRDGRGPDDSFSLEPIELTGLCKDVYTSWSSLGKIDYSRKISEKPNVKFRRSLYFVKSLKAGEIVTSESIRSVRPGFGVAPKYYTDIIGAKILVDVEKNTPVLFQHFK